MNQIIPLILIFLCIGIPTYYLVISPLQKGRSHKRTWEKIENSLSINKEIKFKISIAEQQRVVKPSERIIVKEMANKTSIPITLLTLEAQRFIPCEIKIEYGGDEKWTPKQKTHLPYIFHKGHLHFWSGKNVDWKKFLQRFENPLLSIAHTNNPNKRGYTIDANKNKINFREDYIIKDETRILKIVDVLRKLSIFSFSQS